MIYCKKCGEKMFAKIRHNSTKKFVYDYICSSKLKGNASLCNIDNLNGQQIDDLVCDYLMDYLNEDSEIFNLLENLKLKISNQKEQDNVSIIDNKIAKYILEIENLISSLAKPNVNSALFQFINNKVAELDNLINSLKKEKEQITNQAATFINDNLQFDIIVRTLAYFKENFKTLDIHSKRELIKLLVEKIEWDGKNLNIFIYGE